MLQRYRDLPDARVGPLGGFLEHVEGQRRPLLDELAAAQKLRGDIPPAADLELNALRALTDRFLGAVLGDETLHQRVIDTEFQWQSLLRKSMDLDSRRNEADPLQRLIVDSQRSIELLGAPAD